MSFDYTKTNKMFWDVEANDLYELAYSMYIEETNKTNNEFARMGIQTRITYTTLSNFITLVEFNSLGFNNVLNKAVIELRKEKIFKILNGKKGN